MNSILSFDDVQPKSYQDFLQEISEEDLYEGLLGFGLFDEKLPPVFTSESFVDYCRNAKLPGAPKTGWGFATYRSIRNMDGERIMGIPHPIAYALLCKELSSNWEKIRNKLIENSSGQAHKVSRIHFRKQVHTVKLFEMNYGTWRQDGDPIPEIQIRAQFLVKSDIAQCFPSIYSHAVSWALVGKEEAKKNRSDQNYWPNKIDYALRNCTSSETHGILIGPHASNLLSEVILTCIDSALVDKGYKFVRYIDDYLCFTETHRQAEEFIQDLDAELFKFGLMRNQKKTEILQLPIALDEEWPRALKSFPLPRKEKLSRGQVLAFLDYAVDLLHDNAENAAVLNYAIRMLSNRDLTGPAEKLLIQRSLQFVRLFPYLAPVVDKCVFEKVPIQRQDIASLATDLCDFAKERKTWFPAYYAIYFSLKYDFSLGQSFTVIDAIASGDCVLMALELMYAKAHSNSLAIKSLKEEARELQKSGDTHSNWIFIYEALSKEEIKGDLKPLKELKISFLRPLSEIREQ